MNTMRWKGNWNVVKGKVKQAVSRITEDERQFIEGKADEIFGRLQKRRGKNHQHLKRALHDSYRRSLCV